MNFPGYLIWVEGLPMHKPHAPLAGVRQVLRAVTAGRRQAVAVSRVTLLAAGVYPVGRQAVHARWGMCLSSAT